MDGSNMEGWLGSVVIGTTIEKQQQAGRRSKDGRLQKIAGTADFAASPLSLPLLLRSSLREHFSNRNDSGRRRQ
jgi:hypothetical protein